MYLDSSILVKLLVPEKDSAKYSELTQDEHVSSSFLSYAEVCSALLRKEREKVITSEQRAAAWLRFQKQVQEETIELVAVSDAIVKRAAKLSETCSPSAPLRSLDAIHLATSDQTQDWPFVTADEKLKKSARFLKFPIL